MIELIQTRVVDVQKLGIASRSVTLLRIHKRVSWLDRVGHVGWKSILSLGSVVESGWSEHVVLVAGVFDEDFRRLEPGI